MNFKADKPSTVCAILGSLGATVSLVIGFYLVSTMENFSSFQDETLQIGIAATATVTAAMVTYYGSLTILNSSPRKGGRINIAGGAVLIATYAYFSEFTRPKMLGWLNPQGIALVIPPLFSGLISLLGNKENQNTSITAA